MPRKGQAFSNGTAWEIWSANWCYAPCARDVLFQRGINKTGCPILFQAMFGEDADGDRVIPDEWLEQEGIQDYHCIMFKPLGGGGGGEPKPKPDPQKGPGLFPRPERAVRMLVPLEPASSEVFVGA